MIAWKIAIDAAKLAHYGWIRVVPKLLVCNAFAGMPAVQR